MCITSILGRNVYNPEITNIHLRIQFQKQLISCQQRSLLADLLIAVNYYKILKAFFVCF